MEESDFDALCEGLSAEEVKRLRKILVSWAAGDEHSFPVQMALLTRAQWQMAARLPRQLAQSCELLDRKLSEYRAQTAQLLQGFERTTAARCKELEAILSSQEKATAQTVAGIEAHLANAEMVGSQVRHEIEQGAAAWRKATADFEDARQRLDASRKELETQQRKRDWIWATLVLSGALILGVVIGFQLSLNLK